AALSLAFMSERNIAVFHSDTLEHGGYVYTAVERWSSRVATGKQTVGILRLLEKYFPRAVRIADIGCGDAAFTLDIASRFRPASIRGIDPAAAAIEAARQRIPAAVSGILRYEVGDIYDAQSQPGEIAVIRGVLHHLDRPEAAIARLASQFPAVIALEPNG